MCREFVAAQADYPAVVGGKRAVKCPRNTAGALRADEAGGDRRRCEAPPAFLIERPPVKSVRKLLSDEPG